MTNRCPRRTLDFRPPSANTAAIRFHRRTALVVATVVSVGACHDASLPDSTGPEETAIAHRRLPRHELTTENSEWMRRFEADLVSDCYTRRFREADTLGSSDNLNLPSCPSQMVVTPDAGDGTYLLWHSPDAMDGNGSADSLVVTFSRPVGMLAILRGGTHSCYDTTVGQVVAYGADGAELGRSPFNLIPTCSDAMPTLREERAADSRVGAKATSAAPYTSLYAQYAEAMLPIPAGVTRLVFLPPEVWGFTFVNPYFPDDVQQYKRQGTYSLIFRPDEQQPPPALMLTCSDVTGVSDTHGGTTVVRAQPVSCRASLSVEGSTERLQITDWNFVSTDGKVTRNRHEINPEFEPDSTEWRGPMITSGTVTVTGKVGDGSPMTKAAMVRVTPRDWSRTPVPGWPALPEVVEQGWLPPAPLNVHELGQIRWRPHGNNVADSTNSHSLVDSGRNAYFFYVAKLPPLLASLQIAINTAALTAGSDFWKAQPEYNPRQVYSSSNRCYRSDVTSEATRDKILTHEGANWELTPASHAGVLRELTFSLVVPAAESVFVKAEEGVQGLRERWRALVFPVQDTVSARAGTPVDVANPVQFGSVSHGNLGCVFTFSP